MSVSSGTFWLRPDPAYPNVKAVTGLDKITMKIFTQCVTIATINCIKTPEH